MKKITSILSAISVALSCSITAGAQTYTPAFWAQASFDKMLALDALPDDILSQDYAKGISRRDFAELIHYSYNAFTGEDFKTESVHNFDDMPLADSSVSAIYALGIMQGDENNNFHPYDTITRQETAVVISNFYNVLNDDALSANTDILNKFNDRNKIADWALNYVASVVNAELMGDYDDGEFHPLDEVTIEQAVSMVSRMSGSAEEKKPNNIKPTPTNKPAKPSSGTSSSSGSSGNSSGSSSGGSSSSSSGGSTSGSSSNGSSGGSTSGGNSSSGGGSSSGDVIPTPDNTPSITDTPDNSTPQPDKNEVNGTLAAQCTVADGTLSISWNEITNAVEYKITVTESRNHKRSENIEPYTQKYTTTNTSIDIPSAPGRTYKITVTTGNISEDLEYSTPKISNDKTGFILPNTMEEAEPLMRDIEVNVWKVNSNGEKYASTTSFAVHKDIADIVYDVFQEIFEGDEKFPILWVGGYAWRGGKSEHNWGMALDINPDQNYCIYTSGAVVGNYWLPYEDQYSITPYGDVMNAFENHGFTWGGDAWSGNIDYMHFSYFGT